jgi:hypothetical protein
MPDEHCSVNQVYGVGLAMYFYSATGTTKFVGEKVRDM